MALSRAQPGSGSTFQVLKESPIAYNTTNTLPDFGKIQFSIVGGLATAFYMPERMTIDTDILIAQDDLTAIEDILHKNNAVKLGRLTIGGSTWRLPSGRVLDVIAIDREWVHNALNNVTMNTEGNPIISLPYLVLMKLEAGRLQDIADISRMLGLANNRQLQATRLLIKEYHPEDIDDLESMIKLGKLEHKK